MIKAKNLIIDIIMVLGTAVSVTSLIRYVTIEFVLLPAYLNWLVFFLSCYILRFGRFPSPNNIGKIVRHPLMSAFLILLAWESVQGLLNLENFAPKYIIEFLSYLVAYDYFYNASKKYKTIDCVIKPYAWFYFYSATIIILTAVLVVLGILSPTENPIEENTLMMTNMETGTVYYWPGYLSVLTMRVRMDLFGGLPTFCGLCHEPNVLGSTIFPAFFLVLYLYSSHKLLKYLVILSLLIINLLSFSVTALVCLSVILFLELFVYDIRSQHIGRLVMALLVIGAILIILIKETDIVDQIFTFSVGKFNDTDDSKGYTTNLLLYSLTPTGIIGDGINPREYMDKAGFLNCNVGLISSILINVNLIMLFVYSIKSFMSKIKICHFIGIAALYYSMHSLKSGCLIYNFPETFYIYFLLTYSAVERKRNSIISKEYEKEDDKKV